MRGLSLSINILIIVILAVIVLLAVASLFMGSFVPTSSTMSDMDAWNRGCGLWRLRGCTLDNDKVPKIVIPGYDPDGDGEYDSLGTVYVRLYGGKNPEEDKTTAEDCHKKCCASPSSSS